MSAHFVLCYMLESHCWADLGNLSQETTQRQNVYGTLRAFGTYSTAHGFRWPCASTKYLKASSVMARLQCSHPQGQPALSLLHQGVRKL